MMQIGDTVITAEDLGHMLRENPLAAEQVKRIALTRQNVELQAEIEKLRNGKGEPKTDAKVAAESHNGPEKG